ncbi:unnamed protein product, partial [Closterium sp. NIES-53]
MAASVASSSAAILTNQGARLFAPAIPLSKTLSGASLHASRVRLPRVTPRGTHGKARLAVMAQAKIAAASSAATEPLSAGSPAPALFDGTTRLYHYKACPFAQRAVIAVNYKGLDFIERVEISLRSKPEWYTERVYPPGKVPAMPWSMQGRWWGKELGDCAAGTVAALGYNGSGIYHLRRLKYNL